MKISRVYLENFKRFDKLEIKLNEDILGELPNSYLLLGDNGSGKTTVLQAIALCLSMASGRVREVSEFDWPGWMPGRYCRWGKPLIELDVHFSDDEIDATIEVAKKWLDFNKPEQQIIPPNNSKLRLRLIENWIVAEDTKGDVQNKNLFQFKGRQYASQLIKYFPEIRDFFPRLPGYFYFDQFRNFFDFQKYSEYQKYSENIKEDIPERISHNIGIGRLRQYLNNWQLRQGGKSDSRSNWLKQLEESYKKLFVGRSFAGVVEDLYDTELPTTDKSYFLFSHENRTYDIEEMSAGEQSVFPMLFEFVRMQIANSVVLIDEVDLNLHPPLAQSLVNVLPSLGRNCQFFLTTHSEVITSIFNPDNVYRFTGGKLCL